MTLTANGPAPSLVPVNQDYNYKSESPPANEMERNRFKESLDKAIAEETAVSEGMEKTPQKEDRAEVHNNAADSVKKLVDEKKKLFRGEKKSKGESIEKLSVESLKKEKKSDSDLVSLVVPVEKDLDFTEESPKLLSKKSAGKKVIANSEDQAPVESLQHSIHESKGEEILPTADIPAEVQLNENSDSKETDSEEAAAVVLPFPGVSENEALNQSVVAKSEINEKSNGLKASSGKTTKGKEEQTLTVIDARSSENPKTDKSSFVSKTASISDSVDQTAKESNQIILGEQNIERAGVEEAKSFESRFNENKEVVLARELKDSGNDQIVKKASFILKDNNQGEIKLILKPEALGRVKIQLNMNENNLVGKIIVENSRVGQIFENNLSDLSKSFEEAGIPSSSIEVSVGDGNKQSGDQNKSFQNDQPYFSDRLKTLDEAVPVTGRYGSENRDQLVNLVV